MVDMPSPFTAPQVGIGSDTLEPIDTFDTLFSTIHDSELALTPLASTTSGAVGRLGTPDKAGPGAPMFQMRDRNNKSAPHLQKVG